MSNPAGPPRDFEGALIPSASLEVGKLTGLIKITSPNAFARGAISSIYRGVLSSTERGDLDVAIKVHPAQPSETDSQLVKRELAALTAVEHPRIVPFLGVCHFATNGAWLDHAAFIMPYYAKGDLDTNLPKYTVAERLQLMLEVSEGLQYLHEEAGIVHGDLKPFNVLISDQGTALLSGFGLATTVTPGDTTTKSEIRAWNTLRYAAPEILLDQVEGDEGGRRRSKSCATDCYSFGMLVLHMVTGQYPWKGVDNLKLLFCLLEYNTPPRWETDAFDERLWTLCSQCWTREPRYRPSARDIQSRLKIILAGPVGKSDHDRPTKAVNTQGATQAAETGHDDKDEHNRDSHSDSESAQDIRGHGLDGSAPPSEPGSHPFSTPSERFDTCPTWPSSPLAATAMLAAVVDFTEYSLQFLPNDTSIKLIIPKGQKVRAKGATGTILKGYGEVDGRIHDFAVKMCQDVKIMDREIAIWRELRHEHLLPFHGFHEIPPMIPGMRICFLLSPFMKQGNLVEYLARNALADRLCLMSQVASGLSYLHDEARIVHGDIKANILITNEGNALLADFGLSTTVASGPNNTTENLRQRYTLAYCAPEIVDDTAEDPIAPGVKRSKTKMSDVYAYGVLLYQTYAGGLGNTRAARYRLMGEMYEGRFPPRPLDPRRIPVFCDDLWSVCTRCWVPQPSERPKISIVHAELCELRNNPEKQVIVTAPEPAYGARGAPTRAPALAVPSSTPLAAMPPPTVATAVPVPVGIVSSAAQEPVGYSARKMHNFVLSSTCMLHRLPLQA